MIGSLGKIVREDSSGSWEWRKNKDLSSRSESTVEMAARGGAKEVAKDGAKGGAKGGAKRGAEAEAEGSGKVPKKQKGATGGAGPIVPKGKRGGARKKEATPVSNSGEEELTEVPPAHVKVGTPGKLKPGASSLGVRAAQGVLQKLEKTYLQTTVQEQIKEFIPEDLKAIKPDGIVTIPIGYLSTEDEEIGGEVVSFNPRQLNAEGVARIRQRFRINGFDTTRSILTGVVSVSRLSFWEHEKETSAGYW